MIFMVKTMVSGDFIFPTKPIHCYWDVHPRSVTWGLQEFLRVTHWKAPKNCGFLLKNPPEKSSFWNLKKSSSRKIEDEIWWNPESKNHDPSLDLDLGKTFQERSGREIPHDFKTPNCCPWSDMVNYDHPSHHGRSKHQGGKTLTIWLWHSKLENPKNKWRFLAGKIIYKWAIYTIAMLNNQRVQNWWGSPHKTAGLIQSNFMARKNFVQDSSKIPLHPKGSEFLPFCSSPWLSWLDNPNHLKSQTSMFHGNFPAIPQKRPFKTSDFTGPY